MTPLFSEQVLCMGPAPFSKITRAFPADLRQSPALTAAVKNLADFTPAPTTRSESSYELKKEFLAEYDPFTFFIAPLNRGKAQEYVFHTAEPQPTQAYGTDFLEPTPTFAALDTLGCSPKVRRVKLRCMAPSLNLGFVLFCLVPGAGQPNRHSSDECRWSKLYSDGLYLSHSHFASRSRRS